MPSGYITIPNSVSGLDLRAHWWTEDDSGNNRSKVYVQMQGRKTDGYTTYGTYEGDVYIGGWLGVSSSSESIGSGWTDLGGNRWNWIGHNSDGSKTTTLGARGRIPGTSFGSTQSGTGNVTLTNYTRLPSAPGTPSVSDIGPQSASFSWSAPGSVGGGIVEYQYQYDSDGSSFPSPGTVSTGSSRSASRSDLEPGKTYWLRVRARNGDGWGSWSGTRSFETLGGGRRKVAGVWRDVVRWRKVSGQWKKVRRWKKVSGVWKPTR